MASRDKSQSVFFIYNDKLPTTIPNEWNDTNQAKLTGAQLGHLMGEVLDNGMRLLTESDEQYETILISLIDDLTKLRDGK